MMIMEVKEWGGFSKRGNDDPRHKEEGSSITNMLRKKCKHNPDKCKYIQYMQLTQEEAILLSLVVLAGNAANH